MLLLEQSPSISTPAFEDDGVPRQENQRAQNRPNQKQFQQAVVDELNSYNYSFDHNGDPEERKYDEVPNFNQVPDEVEQADDEEAEVAIVINERKRSPINRSRVASQITTKKSFENQISNRVRPHDQMQNDDEEQDELAQINELEIRKKKLEIELMQLTIDRHQTRSKLKSNNSFIDNKSSKSVKMEPEENKDRSRSFEYFDQQDLDDSEFFRTPNLQAQADFKSPPSTQTLNIRSVKSVPRAQKFESYNNLNQYNQTNKKYGKSRPTSAMQKKNNRLPPDTDKINQIQILGSVDQDFEESDRKIILGEYDVQATIQENSNKRNTIIHLDNHNSDLNLSPSTTPLDRHAIESQATPNVISPFKKIIPSAVSLNESSKSSDSDKEKKSKKRSKSKKLSKDTAKKKQKKGGNDPDGDGPGSYPLPMEMLGNFEEADELNFFEPISYSKLERVISQRHPVDPETKSRFSIKDRITVMEYEAKLSDMCYCYAANQYLKEKAKTFKKLIQGPKVKLERPPSMKDMPESNSSSGDEEDGVGGLTQCSLALGEGATLYLQMMKTLTIMFVILTLMNIPLFCFYEQNTTGNQLGNLQKVFKYFTLGNLGQMDKRCSWSSFESNFNESAENEQFISVDCGEGYIGELQDFGFMYQFDKLYGGDSVASERCKFIENPMIRYKKPAPKPFCTQEQLDEIQEQNDPLKEKECRIKPDETEEEKVIIEAEPKEPIADKNKTDDIDIQVTPYNIDPQCEYINKTKHNENLWINQDAESAFKNWFEKECYFSKSCVFDVNKIGKHYQDSLKSMNKVMSIGPTPMKNQKIKVDEDKEMTFFDMVSDDCKARMGDIKVTSQQYIGVVGCKYDDVLVPFSGGMRLHKEWIGVIILLCDILSILMMYYFFSSIRKLNLEVLESMDDLLVQMKDFGIKIDDVKLDRYTQDSRLIKMKIWLHFTKLFQNRELMQEHDDENQNSEEEDEEISNSGEEKQQENKKKNKKEDSYCFKLHPIHQVLDVCLSIYTQPSIQCVFRMQDLQLEINDINNKLRTGGFQGEEVPEKQDELKALIEKQKRFEQRYNELTKKKKQVPGQTMTVERVSKSQRLKEIQYIFVIFKNCETASVVHSIYPKENTMMNAKKKEFELFGKQPRVVPILEPDEIIWENLAYTKDQQQVRRYIIQVISVFFLLGNTLFTMYLSGFRFYLNKKIPALNCDPELTYTKIDAYRDQMKIYQDDSPQGLLGCYCSRETSLFAPWSLIPHNFQEFSDLIPEKLKKNQDNWNYCAEWQLLQIVKSILMFLISTSAVFINEIVADIFQQLGQFQKKHTKIEEQILCFRQIFSQEYINMGIVILVTSFDNIGIKATLLGELAGRYNVYTGFDPNWYMDYGNKICVFIFMSSFVVNSKDVILFIRTVLKRFRDRSFKMNLKLDPEDEGCDLPNTKIRIQSDLEALYTGKEFKGEKAYSRMMSTMFVILMYSSGMPIMYFTGAVFYIVTFMVNKFLLINFYQKSRTLTRTIPLFAIDFMQYALFMHSFISLLMLTNPVAFKTKNRLNEEGKVIGVDPPINITSAIQNITLWIQSDEPDVQKIAEQIHENPYIEILIQRLQFFHQQMFLAFLATYVMILFLGKSIYGILYVMFLMTLKLINAILQYLKKQAKEAKQRVQSKILLRQQSVSIVENSKEGHKQSKPLPADSFQSDSSMKDEVISGLNIINRSVGNQDQDEAEVEARMERIDDALQNVFETESDKVKREKQELRDQRMKDIAAKKKLKRADYSDNILSELSCENLSNFYQRCKRERQDFWEIFRWDEDIGDELLTDNFEEFADHRTLFLETLYTYRIFQDDVILYQNFLNDRLLEIETFIDKYFDLFKPKLLEKMKEGYARDRERLKKIGKEGTLKDQVNRRKHEEWALQFSDDVQFDDLEHFPHERKLKILTEYQEDLIQANKDQKENRLGIQQICRMTGSLAQSYFIFDSHNYKVGRKIYFTVQEESEEKDEDDMDILLGNEAQSDSSSSSSASSSKSSQINRTIISSKKNLTTRTSHRKKKRA